MKYLLSTTYLVLFFCLDLQAQEGQPIWQDMMQDPKANYFETVKAFNDYWADRPYEKHRGYTQFKRWEYINSNRVDEEGKIPRTADLLVAYQQVQSRSSNGNWIEMGPQSPYGNYSAGLGRLNAVAVNPTDQNHILVGAPAAGLWITKDGGENWQNPFESFPKFGVSAVLFDHSDPNTIYVGTGDRDASDSDGVGMLKTIDGGETWDFVNQGLGDLTVSRMVMDPEDNQTIVAATLSGIRKTIDGGLNWEITKSGSFRDIDYVPGDFTNMYACSYSSGLGRVYRSDDAGDNWVQVDANLPSLDRCSLGISPAAPEVIYVVAKEGLFRSEDAGDNFELIFDDATDDTDILTNHSWYNSSLCISPTDENTLIVGDNESHISRDGGQTWRKVNGTHVDNHEFRFDPFGRLIFCDDGGVSISEDLGETWNNISNGLGISMMYKVATHPTEFRMMLQGYQDCGSKLFNGIAWNPITGGDGMNCFFSHDDPDLIFTTSQYGYLYRSKDGGATWDYNVGPEEEGPWVSPLKQDLQNPETVYVGLETIWRTTNALANNISWEDISPGVNWGDELVTIEQCEANPSIMYVSGRTNSGGKRLFRCDDVYAAEPSWTNLSSNLGGGSLRSIETHPSNEDIVYAALGTRIFRSEDKGESFEVLPDGLPNAALNVVVLDKVNAANEALYAAGTLGVFYKDKTMDEWVPFNSGLSANAAVNDLVIAYRENHTKSAIRAATYGRGMWESKLYSDNISAPSATYPILSKEQGNYAYGDFDVDIKFFRYVEKVDVLGFNSNDIEVENGTVLELTGGQHHFSARIAPDTYGPVTIIIPDNACLDDRGYQCEAGNTLVVDYLEPYPELGHTGPGGVGDRDDLSIWLRADKGVNLAQEGDLVASWADISGNQGEASQTNGSDPLIYRVAAINGQPALEVDPSNRSLTARNVPVSENLAAFTVAQSRPDLWSHFAWLGNSRQENGFMLHCNRNTRNLYGAIYSSDNSETTTSNLSTFDITIPHAYGVMWTADRQEVMTLIDNQFKVDQPGIYYDRSSNAEIDVMLGKDFGNRYGDGWIAEHILYRAPLNQTQLSILNNYFSSRYGTDLGEEDYYSHDIDYGQDVAGIGKNNSYDYHLRAKGPGMPTVSSFESSMDDQSFLLWGHNGANDASWSTTGDYNRIDRSWRVSKQGEIDLVKITVDPDDLPLSPVPLGLLISENEDFSGDVQQVLLEEVGEEASAYVSLQDGQFFTFFTADNIATDLQRPNLQSTSLSPNPAIQGQSSLSLGAAGKGTIQLLVIDEAGRQVMQQEKQGDDGHVTFSIDLQAQPEGLYLLHVRGKEFQQSFQLAR